MTPGELVVGRKFRRRDRALLPLAGGRWIVGSALDGYDLEAAAPLAHYLAAVYLVTDANDCIVWLGQARRDAGLLARLRAHLSIPERARIFHRVRAIHLNDFTPALAVSAIEGRAADLLQLRGRLGARKWPTAEEWASLAGPQRAL